MEDAMSEDLGSDPMSYPDPLVFEDPSLTDYTEPEGFVEAGLDTYADLEATDRTGQTDLEQDSDTDPDDIGAMGDDDVAGVPTELHFGSLNGPDGVTNDSFASPYDYNHGTGTTLDQTGREIDPWTGTAKK